jgi:HSP20 family protein
MKLIRNPHLWAPARLDDWFDRAFADLGAISRWAGLAEPFEQTFGAGFATDVYEDDQNYYVRAELPGAQKDEISLRIADGVLHLGYEKKNEDGEDEVSLTRNLRLPGPVDSEKVTAKLVDGILTVTIPRHEASKPRAITIE